MTTQSTTGLVERLLEPDWHDPACPFRVHCYCDDGAPHDRVRHPLAFEAANLLSTQDTTIAELVAALETIAGPPERDPDLPPIYQPRWSAHQCRDIARDALTKARSAL